MSNEFHRLEMAKDFAVFSENLSYELEQIAYDRLSENYKRIRERYISYYKSSEDMQDDFLHMAERLNIASDASYELMFRELQESLSARDYARFLLKCEREDRENSEQGVVEIEEEDFSELDSLFDDIEEEERELEEEVGEKEEDDELDFLED